LAGRVLVKVVYLLTCRLLGRAVLVFRSDLARDAELLVLRHENAVLRRHVGRTWYEPASRPWFAALAQLIPRRRWSEVFAVTPATTLAWHRKLAAKKYARELQQLLEHRDLAVTVGGERHPAPARPAGPDPEACDLGHQVELGRPHFAA
jgi:hypothetical protein